MVASRTVRILAATTLLASLALHVSPLTPATAAQPDSAVQVTLTSGSSDRVTTFDNSPPPGFADVAYNDANWPAASNSPCADPAWSFPTGATNWDWASSCTIHTVNIVLRRSFIVPARDVITARLWLSAHGDGLAFVNGQQVAESSGDPVLVDVTRMLRGNGAKNVLAVEASLDNNGEGGVAYALQITLSKIQVAAYTRAHPSTGRKGQSGTGASGAPTPGTSSQIQITCATNPPANVAPVYTKQSPNAPAATGWVAQSNTQNMYLATRLVDINTIQSALDMPSVRIGGQIVRAGGVATDDLTGEQVLSLPPTTTIGPLSIGQPHNQPIGQIAQVTAYSSSRSCLVIYHAQVIQYIQRADGGRFAQIDTVPYGDAADGAVAYDGNGNIFGVLTFGTVSTNNTQIVPLVLPASQVLSSVNSLINVLAKQQTPTAAQHVITVNSGLGVTRVDGGATPASGTTTPAPGATPGATGTPTH